MEQNYALAVKNWRKAAFGGIAEAQFKVGQAWMEGRGTEYKSVQNGLACWRKAADGGYSRAMNCLGLVYSKGDLVEQDYAKAVEWFEKGVELDDADAMFFLGECYHKGEGVEKDLKKAKELYSKSSKLGSQLGMLGTLRLKLEEKLRRRTT